MVCSVPLHAGPATGSGRYSGNPTRLLCIDDHPLFLEGLTAVLESSDQSFDITPVSTMEAALDLLERGLDYDLITLDWSLPDAKGGTLLQYIRQHRLFIPVLVVSASENPADLSLALSSGASGYVTKNLGRQALLEGVSKILAGEPCVCPSELLQALDSEDLKPPELTTRQLEVLERLGRGWSNRAICESLGLTEHTVKSHVKALFQAFQVKNRTECVRRAQQLGLIS